MRVFDNIFDKRWLDETVHRLTYAPWYANNIANNYTWPYGEKGTHKLLGDVFFERYSIDNILYHGDKKFSLDLIDAYYQILKKAERKLVLQQIGSNLQFMGMNGTTHVDSTVEDDYAYIMMLADDPTEIGNDDGGEFVNVELNETVPFKYGRVMEIRAKDKHYGKAFNKPHVCRFSLKFVGTDKLFDEESGLLKVTRRD